MPCTRKAMNVLIIGGSGFVSGTLSRTALAQGHNVWAVTRGQKALPAGVTPLVADRHDEAALAAAIAQAGISEWDMVADCIGYDKADAEQDVRLFRECAKHLVFISTDFVFDPAKRLFPQPVETDYYLTDESYGAKKRRCELVFLNSDCGDMQWTIVRPCHIYGPGSLLGCLPLHGRDPQLIARMRAGEALKLVGGGYFLQQPIFASDLAKLMLSAAGNRNANHEIFCTAGPDIIESRDYYEIIADVLGVPLKVEELLVDKYRAEHPEHISFLCHRIYRLDKIRDCGLAVPATSILDGLRQHTESLL